MCRTCSKDPWKVEECRQKLADKGNYNSLRKFYTSAYPEIRDLNTKSFWNKKYEKMEGLKCQDGMTKDRVKIAVGFLPDSAKTILDVGAGYGFIEEIIGSSNNREIYGNDISTGAIGYLKKNFSGHFRLESIYKMDYPEKFFDAVFVLEILEHIPPSKILPVLTSLRMLLKNKGSLIVSVPTNEGLEKMRINLSGHVRMYTLSLIKAELEIVGFNVKKYKAIFAFKNLYVIKKILSKILSSRWKPNNIIVLAEKK